MRLEYKYGSQITFLNTGTSTGINILIAQNAYKIQIKVTPYFIRQAVLLLKTTIRRSNGQLTKTVHIKEYNDIIIVLPIPFCFGIVIIIHYIKIKRKSFCFFLTFIFFFCIYSNFCIIFRYFYYNE